MPARQFNLLARKDIARKTAADIAPLRKALALIEELRNWGPDQNAGDLFEVRSLYSTELQRTLVICSYGNLDAEGDDVDTIVMGVPGDGPDVFRAYIGRTGTEETLQCRCMLLMKGEAIEYTPATAEQPLLRFIYAAMMWHSRFEEMQDEVVDQACKAATKPAQPKA